LRGGATPIELHAEGLRHPRSARFGGVVFTPYRDVTHVVSGPGGIRLGTRGGSFVFRRGEFADAGAHHELARELERRIGALPDGPARLERMARLDALAARPGWTPVSAAVTALCVAVFGLQLLSPLYETDGFFSAILVRLGEPWRIVTANFLHASSGHLALNGLGLAMLGAFAERSLGSRGTGPVLALAGLGAMAASYAAGYEHALGASGLVAGLAGALLWLELRAPEALPVSWRLPRRLFVAVVALDTIFLAGLPGIAHAAHAGGFAAGGLAAAAVGPRLRDAGGPRPGLALLNALALGAALLAGAAWVRGVQVPDPTALARRGEAFLEERDVSPDLLNNEAWRIAISGSAGADALETARRMAERAAEETEWSEPEIVDTLAEIHFLAGRPELACELAEVAIGLAPEEAYYREQLRRFQGDRAPEDRPGAPAPEPRELPRPRDTEPDGTAPGLRV
jgi:rhomboid protease GluP